MDEPFQAAIRTVVENGCDLPPIADPMSPHSRLGQGGASTREVVEWTGSTANFCHRLLAIPFRVAWLYQAIGMALWKLRGNAALDEVRLDDGWADQLFAALTHAYFGWPGLARGALPSPCPAWARAAIKQAIPRKRSGTT